jgi:hypothetical protein
LEESENRTSDSDTRTTQNLREKLPLLTLLCLLTWATGVHNVTRTQNSVYSDSFELEGLLDKLPNAEYSSEQQAARKLEVE